VKNYLFHVGIYVSKLKLDIVALDIKSSKKNQHFIAENNKKDIKFILDYLQKK